MPGSRKIGISLLAAAVVALGAWKFWVNSRTWCPVRVPLSLAENSKTTTPDFKVNVSGHYDIGVEATANNSILLKDLTCQLGTGPLWPEKTCSKTSVLKASWTITSEGKRVTQGLSNSDSGGWTAEGWSQAGRTIGGFDAGKGQTFKLSVVTLQNAASISPANPTLTVQLRGTLYESTIVVGGALRLVCVVLAVLGIVLLGVSFRKPRAPIVHPA